VLITRDHTVLPATHTFIHIWNESSCLSPAAEHRCIWPVLISRPAEGRRLSRLGWLRKMLRWLARPKMVTHPVLAVAAENRTRDHRVASPTPYTTRVHGPCLQPVDTGVKNDTRDYGLHVDTGSTVYIQSLTTGLRSRRTQERNNASRLRCFPAVFAIARSGTVGAGACSSKLGDNKSCDPVCEPPMMDCETDINRRRGLSETG